MWKYILPIIVLCIIIIIHLYLQDAKQLKNFDNTYLDKLYDRFKHRFEKSATGIKPDAVDMIYCIRSEKRHEYVTNEINKIGLKVMYLDAIFPKDLTKEDYDTLVRKFINPFSHPEFCYLRSRRTATCVQISHLMCYLHAFEHSYDTIMIMEDDIKIDMEYNNFIESINEFMKSIGSMLYMGYCWMSCNQDDSDKNSYNHILKLSNKHILCTQGIVYKTDFLKDYVYNLFPIKYHCDYSINKYCIDNNKDIFITKKPLIEQNKELESLNGTIVMDNTTKMCDFT